VYFRVFRFPSPTVCLFCLYSGLPRGFRPHARQSALKHTRAGELADHISEKCDTVLRRFVVGHKSAVVTNTFGKANRRPALRLRRFYLPPSYVTGSRNYRTCQLVSSLVLALHGILNSRVRRIPIDYPTFPSCLCDLRPRVHIVFSTDVVCLRLKSF
jgi:hypothetical protein